MFGIASAPDVSLRSPWYKHCKTASESPRLVSWYHMSLSSSSSLCLSQDLGLPMLSDIKSQLNQMQSQSAASATRDAEAIAEVVRNEIRRAMMVRGTSGLTIQDTIDEKRSGLARDDRLRREDGGDDQQRLAWLSLFTVRFMRLVHCLLFFLSGSFRGVGAVWCGVLHHCVRACVRAFFKSLRSVAELRSMSG